jgi:hypothetical protein
VLSRIADAVPPVEPDRPLRADVLRAADVLDDFAREVEPRWSS